MTDNMAQLLWVWVGTTAVLAWIGAFIMLAMMMREETWPRRVFYAALLATTPFALVFLTHLIFGGWLDGWH